MSHIKIISEKQNPLFNRKEVKVLVEAPVTPSKADAERTISEKYSSDVSNIKIEAVRGKFGRKTFLIDAKIYHSAKDKNSMEKQKEKKKK